MGLMALACRWCVFCVLVMSSSILAAAAPNLALLAPIVYHPSTSLYSLTSLAGPAAFTTPLLLDITSSNLWLDCHNYPTYNSPSTLLTPVPCNSPVCHSANVCNFFVCGSPSCSNSNCRTFISNSAIPFSSTALLFTHTLSFLSTNGRNPRPPVLIPKFAFACTSVAPTVHPLPARLLGVAGLSRSLLSLPHQLSSKLSNLKNKFTYCLPSTANGTGVLFFGDSPLVFPPNDDLTQYLLYTPLLRDTTRPDSYFISVNSITVGGTELSIDPNLLKIKYASTGNFTTGGTLISSTVRYTQLDPSIYDALASEFKVAAIARGAKEVTAIAPFDTCFETSTVDTTRTGYNVPGIDLLIQNSGDAVWGIPGAHSVIELDDGKVLCLAFERTRNEYEGRGIVLGTFQQQDGLLQFDLINSRLGFLPTLLGFLSTCSNFNFTSTS